MLLNFHVKSSLLILNEWIVSMNIYLNGELQHTHHQNLYQLIQDLSLEGKRFAVEMNEMIVSKSKLAETPISDSDRIEIIHAVGGG